MKKFFHFLLMLDIDRSAKIEACVELFINTIFSTLPIWFSAIIYATLKRFETGDENIVFLDHFKIGILNSVSSSELLMYATATLGPILYLNLSASRNRENPTPWVKPQLIISILLNLFSTVIFFYSREKGFSSNESFVLLTLFIYISSLIILYPSMAFHHGKMPNIVGRALIEGQKEFDESYDRHRG